MENIQEGISVIVCCYNSAERLPDTLKYLALQEVRYNIAWEVIIVNNASTDNTLEVAEKVLCQYRRYSSAKFKLVDENIPGLASARRRGLLESKYDVIVFCDDDNHLEKNYLQVAYGILKRKPELGVLGGWAKPKLAFYPGKWIEGMYGAMAISTCERSDGYVDWVFGAGMVIRREVFNKLQSKNIKFMLTGREGKKQTSGEDVEVCYLAKLLGYKIWFSNLLVLYHYMCTHRLEKMFFIKGNYRNIYPSFYLFVLEKIVESRNYSFNNLYKILLYQKFKMLLYFFPRILLGKRSFYSFMMFYQSLQMVGWLLLRKNDFISLADKIEKNIYNERRYEL